MVGLYLGWAALALVVAAIALFKGWPDIPFFALSIFLSPVVGLAVVLLLPSRVEANLCAQGVLRPCPHCQGLIKAEATCCKHCGGELPGETVLYEGESTRVTNRGIVVLQPSLAGHVFPDRQHPG